MPRLFTLPTQKPEQKNTSSRRRASVINEHRNQTLGKRTNRAIDFDRLDELDYLIDYHKQKASEDPSYLPTEKVPSRYKRPKPSTGGRRDTRRRRA